MFLERICCKANSGVKPQVRTAGLAPPAEDKALHIVNLGGYT